MLSNEVCSNYISPVGLFFMRFFAWPIFRLTLLTFRPQKRDKQVAPSGHYVLLEPFRSVSAQTVLETYTLLMVWGAVLRGWHPPPFVDPPPPLLAPPPPTALLPPTQCCPRCTPPPPVASYWPSQPLAGRLRAIRPTLVGYVFNFFAGGFFYILRKNFHFVFILNNFFIQYIFNKKYFLILSLQLNY